MTPMLIEPDYRSLAPWLRLHRLIRAITETTWDEASWPKAKAVLRDALAMRGRLARRPEWI